MGSSSEREGKKQNTTEFISEENVKNFLKKNNISLEKIGGEEEQAKFITRLSDSLLYLKKAILYKKEGVSRDDQAKQIVEARTNLGKVFNEAGFSSKASDEIINNFIPSKTPTKEDAQVIKELRAEIDALKKRVEELEQQGEPKPIEVEPVPEPEPEPTEPVPEPEPTEPVHPTRNPEDPIPTEGRVIGESDETARGILGDMIHQLGELNKQKQALKKTGEKYTPIGKGVVNICKWSRDVLRERIILGGVDYLDRDIMLGGAFIATTAFVLVPGYVAGRVAGKVIKGVAKLGVKAVTGVGNTMFKAAKGTAKKCKARVDKNREEKRKVRVGETKQALDEAKEITTMILDYSQTRETAVTKKNDISYSRLSKPKQADLMAIEDPDLRPDTEEKLEKENENLLLEANRKLRSLRLKRISKEFHDKFGLDEISIGEIIHNFKIDKNGELVEIGESLVSLDEISEAGLYDELKKAIEIPKVNEFSRDDIKDIINLLKAENMMQDLDDLVERGEISPEVAEYVTEISDSLNNGFISNRDIAAVRVKVISMELNDDILREAYLRDLVDVAQELHSQILTMEQEFEQIQDGNTRRDAKRREILRKIAEVKVDSLIEHGIVEIVRNENGREQIVINQGRDVLDLTEDLEHTTDLKRDRIERQSQESKQDTEHSDIAE